MKRILFFVCLCGMLLGFTSCEKDSDTVNTLNEAVLYGTVIDASNGAPLYNVQVYLAIGNNLLGTSVTGMDGNYEFTIYDIDTDRSYDALAIKDDYEIQAYEGISFRNIKNGGRVKVDFQLRKEK